MCGISGFVDSRKQSDGKILDRMTDRLVHRGPDGRGTYLRETDSAQTGLGHRRLAVIDLTDAAAQPMRRDQLLICYNGEVYNFREIRRELEQLGFVFHTDSDTEVILCAYQAWKEKCLQHFRGMFAFVIYDEQLDELFCARDRTGVKPFFWYYSDGLFLFASELKSFGEHPNFKKDIDTDALALYLRYGNIPAPYCIYRDTHKLPPAHYFYVRKGIPEGAVSYWSVYDAYNRPKLQLSDEEAKHETKRILKEAFEYRMVSDVPVGVFLSGGYDSTCVTAMLQENRSEPLKTYTIAVPDIGLNEAPFARETAARLGTDHHEFTCSSREAIDLVPEIPVYYDEPFADSSAIPTMLVSEMASRDVTVALSADGGDELFAGYNRYEWLLKYERTFGKLPAFMRRGMAGLMERIPAEKIPGLSKKYNFAQRYEKIKGVLQSTGQTEMQSLMELFSGRQLERLLKRDFHRLPTAYDAEKLKNGSLLEYKMAIDYETYLPDDILTKTDRASMRASLESREPFLDHTIIEWTAQLPDSLKYRQGIKKFLLREIVHDYIPKEVMNRPKTGFAIPLENWLQGELKELVEEYLSEERIRRDGFFDPDETERLKTAFFRGKKEYGTRIWYLLVFSLWYENQKI